METEKLPQKQKGSDTQSQSEEEEPDWSDRFHVSIAWNLEEPHPECVSLVNSISVDEHVRPPDASFDAVKVRIGNVVHNINLRTRITGRIMR